MNSERSKCTTSYSPLSNEINENKQNIVDVIIEKLQLDDPRAKLQRLVDIATYCQNDETNSRTGSSPMQIVTGRYSKIPSLLDNPTC